MTKHVLDHPRTSREESLSRAREMLDKDRPHRATLTLQRRSRLRDPQHRQAEYLRIEREEPAQ